MNLPRSAWALVAVVLVLGLARAAPAHEIEPSLLDLLGEAPACPECPVCEGPWGFDAAIELPDHAQPGDVIHVELRPAYLKRGGKAAILRGRLDREGRQPGVWAERIQPEDAVPEPPGALAVGLAAIALLGRSRGISQATARPT